MFRDTLSYSLNNEGDVPTVMIENESSESSLSVGSTITTDPLQCHKKRSRMSATPQLGTNSNIVSPQDDAFLNHPSGVSKTVCFSSTVRSYAGLALSEFSEEEKASCWYSVADLQDRMQYTLATLDFMETNEFMEDDEHCSRGLETRTQRARKSRASNRAVVFQAIKRESQLRQLYGYNSTGVRSMCWEIYVHDEESARLRALLDEEEAFRILSEDALEVHLHADL